ncbi:MAG: hypothetical protein Q9227_002332 [Pyrenula ochraceoflavens]
MPSPLTSPPPPNPSLHALVDLGSNGLRTSITSLSPPTSRCLPTLYLSRHPISLYSAQFPPSSSPQTRQPIPSAVIDQVVSALRRFKAICEDFGVPEGNVHVLATEATRAAENGAEVVRRIKEEGLGWGPGAEGQGVVRVLGKEEEGRVGAMGIVSSLSCGSGEVEGVVMDLGGGSTQISWMIMEEGKVRMSDVGAVSLPYGAAALTRRLEEAKRHQSSEGGDPLAKLAQEIQDNFREALSKLCLPTELQAKSNGVTLYLSGGGFRGWGYLLMSSSEISPYPIPIINGFRVTREAFAQVTAVQEVAQQGGIFRVSKRRAEQVPAVAFLIQNVLKALPAVKEIRFCQGGVREGYLFSLLDECTRCQHPLVAATNQYAPDGAEKIASLLRRVVPTGKNVDEDGLPDCFDEAFFNALASTMYVHSGQPKESTSITALHLTTTGILASAHGISHEDRALLALALCERWDAELPPQEADLFQRLGQVVSPLEQWWARYLGRVAALIGTVYPAGRVGRRRIVMKGDWGADKASSKRYHSVELLLILSGSEVLTNEDVLTPLIEDIEKMGKKKNWFGAGGDKGLKVKVNCETLSREKFEELKD